jgi:hypothetical protein
MGLFSSKKKVYVSSVAYNLAGDEEDRVDFVKYTVLNSMMQNQSVSDGVVNGILGGTGMKIKGVHRYARDEYTYGVPNSNMQATGSVDAAVLIPVLEAANPGKSISLLTSYIAPADYEFFAEQYLAETYGYDRISGEFDSPPAGADVDATVSYDFNAGVVTFILMNADTSTVSFTHALTGFQSGRMYVHASYRTVEDLAPTDDTTTRPAEVGETDSVTTETLITTIVDEVHTKVTTTTITVVAGTATVQVHVEESIASRSLYYTYLLGSGVEPTLDALLSEESASVPYYPAIPLRVKGVDMCDEAHQSTELYQTSKKLLKRIGVKLDDLADKINENEDIDDVDFAFIVFGVPLVTQTPAGKRYLWDFFSYLDGISAVTQSQFDDWDSSPDKASTAPATNTLQIYDSENRANNYDVKIQWQYIKKSVLSGAIHSAAKIGDVDTSMGGASQFGLEQSSGYTDMMVDSSIFYLRKQIAENTYEVLEVSGLVWQNFIYDGKAVELTAHEAFNNEDEDVGTGFIIPLNRDIFRAMGGRWMTQLGAESTMLVFNCYQVVKQKWYQTGIFKVLLIVVAIVITVLFPPSGGIFAGVVSGLASIGVTGLLATIIAATVTVLGTMVVMNLLTPTLIKVFGEEWGRVLAVVASIAAGGAFNLNVTNLASITAKDLVLAVDAVSKLYSAYAQGRGVEIAADLTEAQKDYDTESERIEDLMRELSGGPRTLDIEGYINAAETYVPEGMGTFLSRTLLTGSQIADLTNGMISEFASMGMDLRSATG